MAQAIVSHIRKAIHITEMPEDHKWLQSANSNVIMLNWQWYVSHGIFMTTSFVLNILQDLTDILSLLDSGMYTHRVQDELAMVV